MTDRKHPSVAFWITVALVAVLVGYPLSWGPWLWIKLTYKPPHWTCSIGDAGFAPLKGLAKRGMLPDRYLNHVDGWVTATVRFNRGPIR